MKLKNIILILIAVLLVGGIIYWANTKKVEEPLSPSPSPTPASSIPAGWKTYRSEEYGFEVQYPDDLSASSLDF